MKRKIVDELPKLSFTDLPEDIQQRIIVENKACECARVSKLWFSTISSYPHWYENIKKALTQESMKDRKVYLVDYSLPSEESESVVSIPEFMEAVDRECASYHLEFKNRMGLFLRRAFMIYVRDRNDEKRQGSLMFNSALTYLRHGRDNALLTITNFHPRDFRINFYEKDHRYNLITKGPLHYAMYTNVPAAKLTEVDKRYKVTPSYLTSTTAFIEPLFSPFIEDEVIDKMMNSRNWPNSRYFGMTREEIKEKWELARTLGTKMHANIEAYYCGRWYSTEGIEWKFFCRFEALYVKGILIALRSEWLIYNEAYRLTGSIDMIYTYADPAKQRDVNGMLRAKMYDWKRATDLLKDNTYQNGSKPCTAHMQDTKKSHYNVQLFMYTFLLKPYNIVIDEWCLVGMHPDQEDFIRVEYKWDQKLMDDLLQYRRDCLAKETGVGAAMTDIKEFIKEPGAQRIIKKYTRK